MTSPTQTEARRTVQPQAQSRSSADTGKNRSARSWLGRIACALLGHLPGDELFRYHYAEPIKSRSQWPGRTYTVGSVGHRCKRCGAEMPA